MVWEGLWSVLEEARIDLQPQLCGDHLAPWQMATAPLAEGGDGDSLLSLEVILWERQVVLEVVMVDEEEASGQTGGKMLEVRVDSKQLPRLNAPSEGGSSPLQLTPFLFLPPCVPQDMLLFPSPDFPSSQRTFHQSFGQSQPS